VIHRRHGDLLGLIYGTAPPTGVQGLMLAVDLRGRTSAGVQRDRQNLAEKGLSFGSKRLRQLRPLLPSLVLLTVRHMLCCPSLLSEILARYTITLLRSGYYNFICTVSEKEASSIGTPPLYANGKLQNHR
jgi:hypothetical protein